MVAATKDKEKISRDKCDICIKYLHSSLMTAASKPKALLHSMGVDTTPSTSSVHPDHNAPSFWEMDKNGMGILIHIPEVNSPSNQAIIDGNKSAFGGTSQLSQKKASCPSEGSNKCGRYDECNSDYVSHSSSTKPTKLQRPPTTAIAVKQPITTGSSCLGGIQSSKREQSNYYPRYGPQLIPLSIMCKVCGTEGPEGSSRAYVRGPSPLSIILCSNRLPTQDDISEVLTHELMHVYDVHRRKWDLKDCDTLARSEVRAAREAECADSSLNFMKRYCVRNKAEVATKNMFPGRKGGACVAKVFEEAMQDNVPLSRNYNTNDNIEREGVRGHYSHRGTKQNSTINGRIFHSRYSDDFHATTASER